MKTLFTDFDGVLHPSTLVQTHDTTTLALHGEQHLLNAGFFRWTAQLEETLKINPNDEVTLVVHSSWRTQKWLSNSLVRALLGPLAHRFAGFVGAEDPREKAISTFVERMGIEDYLIIDDAQHSFSRLQDHLVVTNPLTGIDDEQVLSQVKSWAKSHPRQNRARQACAI